MNTNTITELLAGAGIDTENRAVAYHVMTLVEGNLNLGRLTNDVQGCTKAIAHECEQVAKQTAAGNMPTASWVVNGAKSLAELLADLEATTRRLRETCFNLSLLVAEQDAANVLCARLVALVLTGEEG